MGNQRNAPCYQRPQVPSAISGSSGGPPYSGCSFWGPHLAALEPCWSTAEYGMVAAPRWLARAGRQAVGQLRWETSDDGPVRAKSRRVCYVSEFAELGWGDTSCTSRIIVEGGRDQAYQGPCMWWWWEVIN